ncbi:DUF58 domain-containing protein [Puniceibacterium sediminis]|uniref:DUF58 domain-containing protein n=1 Tax=Puniceibacterium sediminis TaxID=1608407 RepID=A0A238YY13_9RHOB|nr:DUF58 domain-containing protein [Puniceibacterium sediminis]SNR75967.1 Protein of unknown function DUF58 [Puniceibacterium sediminis]
MTQPDDGIHLSLDRLVALRRLAFGVQQGGHAQSHSGGTAGRRRGQGGDIHDLRPFQDGDDPRRVDPAATARSGRPHVRTYHEDVDRTLLLVADFRSPMLWGSRGRLRSIAAAEALALEGWRTIAAGGRVGLHGEHDGGGVTLAPRPREAAMLDIASALVRMHEAAVALPADGVTPDLGTLLAQSIARAVPGTQVVLATGYDQPGQDFAEVAEAAMRKCRLSILLIQDRIELDPPRGVLPVRTPQGLRQVRFSAGTARDTLERIGVPVVAVSAETDLFADQSRAQA